MSDSIISNERECYVCGMTQNLHRHHIFFGAGNRSLSERWGCWVYLCGYHHNLSDAGVHFNKQLDLYLKERAQLAFEELHGHDKFMEVFGRNWL